MASDKRYDPRKELLRVLLAKIAKDTYPSVSMMNMVESMLQPDEVPAYVEVLLDRVRNEHYPSIPMIRRIQKLT